MQYISVISILMKLLFVSGAILLLYFEYPLISLFIWIVISNGIILILDIYLSKRFVVFSYFSKISVNLDLIKKSLIFSILGFFIMLTTGIDLVMISILGSSHEVGLYGVSQQLIQQGFAVRDAVALAFFPIFIKKLANGGVIKKKVILKYSFMTLTVMLLLSVGLYYFATDIIILLFGPEYTQSGDILKYLVFIIAIYWAMLPFTSSLTATYNEMKLVYIYSMSAVLNIILNYFLYTQYGIIGVVYSTIIVFIFLGCSISFIGYHTLSKQGYFV